MPSVMYVPYSEESDIVYIEKCMWELKQRALVNLAPKSEPLLFSPVTSSLNLKVGHDKQTSQSSLALNSNL